MGNITFESLGVQSLARDIDVGNTKIQSASNQIISESQTMRYLVKTSAIDRAYDMIVTKRDCLINQSWNELNTISQTLKEIANGHSDVESSNKKLADLFRG